MFTAARLARLVKLALQVRAAHPTPLRLTLWDGRHLDLGPDPTVTIVVPDPSALSCFLPPDLLKLGEAYVEGKIHVEGALTDVFAACAELTQAASRPDRLRDLLWSITHTRERDAEAVRYHYDVSDEFYRLFLDRDLVYSCAYFRSSSDTLDQAQAQKLDLVLDKLQVRPSHRLLDVGCGWGALITRAVRERGCTAVGITLSRHQHDHAQARIGAEGLEDRCEVRLQDYRDLPEGETYDRIVSVGMLEHVGLKNLGAYHQKLAALLADDGVILNHGITAAHSDNRVVGLGIGEFIDRYVFPDGELPHVSLLLREASDAGLEVVDVESLRRHYARTCALWAERLEQHRAEAVRLVGEKRYRIWVIYLTGSAFGFDRGWTNVYQVLAVKAGGQNPLPLTRDRMNLHKPHGFLTSEGRSDPSS